MERRKFTFQLEEKLLRDFQKWCRSIGSFASVEIRKAMIERIESQKGGSDGKENRPT